MKQKKVCLNKKKKISQKSGTPPCKWEGSDTDLHVLDQLPDGPERSCTSACPGLVLPEGSSEHSTQGRTLMTTAAATARSLSDTPEMAGTIL